ncbi:MAG TPA: hypothetical protein VHM90_07790 [Phycisphaerae bacterium]|jgi:hypothetical protein|nr:hypothetical protein [Phycisphaerae bacterium]
MIDRPLVFGSEVPSIMIYHEQIGRFHSFFESLRVRFETSPFQQSFELIRFPSLTNQHVEELLDQLSHTAN